MALNLPAVPIATRVGAQPASAQSSVDNEEAPDTTENDKHDLVYVRRAAEKEGRSYLMVRAPGFRVIFDHFILASFQKSVEEVVLPNYTRGQTTLEVFGQRIQQVTVELDMIESSSRLQSAVGGLIGYVGQGVRTLSYLYDNYFRGSRLVKKGAIAVLSVKGRQNFGYITNMAFERSSGNDHHVRLTLGMWIPADGVSNVVGARLAQILIANAGAVSLPSDIVSLDSPPREEVDVDEVPDRLNYGSRFADEGELQNRATVIIRDKDDRLILKYDAMYVTQVGDVDSEKVQYETSSHSLNKAWFYGRHLKALSVSAILFDLEQQESAEYPQDQLALFEYLYDHYMRGPQVGHHRYKIQFYVRGHMYEGMMTNYSLGLASDDDNIGAVSFTFLVLGEDPLVDRLPKVFDVDLDLGPATFSRETVEELRDQGDLPRRAVLLDGPQSEVVRRTGLV